MIRLLNMVLTSAVLVLLMGCNTPVINNVKTSSSLVYGNCGMCKKTIEQAVNESGVSNVIWDKETKIAVFTFDSTHTSLVDLLSKIADAGYDSDSFRAKDDVYASLPKCCQYDRLVVDSEEVMDSDLVTSHSLPQEAIIVEEVVANPTIKKAETKPAIKPKEPVVVQDAVKNIPDNPRVLDEVYDAYFLLKDALVNSDPTAASKMASTLSTKLKSVQIAIIPIAGKEIFMAKSQNLVAKTDIITKSSDLKDQREAFWTLSNDMYAVMKVVKPNIDVYHEYCPMYDNDRGGAWLSKEKKIRNPYFGDAMMSCGKVKEIIQK